jgi:acetyl-CoA carboxylase carboxyltransferase component
MINTAELKPVSAAEILAGYKKIATANNAYELNNFQKMQELANGMRKVLNEQVESYKKLVIDTYLDCEYKKVKISKRVAKTPKYARGVCK